MQACRCGAVAALGPGFRGGHRGSQPLLGMLKGLLCLLFPDLPLVSFKKCLSYIYFVFVLIAQNTKMKGWTVLAKFCLPPEGLVGPTFHPHQDV